MSRILQICTKVSDGFTASFVEDGVKKAEYSGYVPDLMPNDHCGDYIELDIDIDSGKILNWRKPTKAQLKALNTNT